MNDRDRERLRGEAELLSRTGLFILNGREPMAAGTEWGAWFETADRRVAFTKLDGVDVSTVFLGIDHGFGRGKLLLFETCVFGGPLDGDICRYEDWEAAEHGHSEIVKRVQGMKR